MFASLKIMKNKQYGNQKKVKIRSFKRKFKNYRS